MTNQTGYESNCYHKVPFNTLDTLVIIDCSAFCSLCVAIHKMPNPEFHSKPSQDAANNDCQLHFFIGNQKSKFNKSSLIKTLPFKDLTYG